MANRKTFLVVLELQGCLCKTLEEIDIKLYEHARGENKGYVYETMQLHDKCYMVIKILSIDNNHEEWLKKALGYPKEKEGKEECINYNVVNIINLTNKRQCKKLQESEKVFLVALKPQSYTGKALDEIDKQLYEHVVGKDKCYAYNTMELHDRCYMAIKIFSDANDHEEWLRDALKQPEEKNEEMVQEEAGSEKNRQNQRKTRNNTKKYEVANITNLTVESQYQGVNKLSSDIACSETKTF